jgi:hypothetical protein
MMCSEKIAVYSETQCHSINALCLFVCLFANVEKPCCLTGGT